MRAQLSRLLRRASPRAYVTLYALAKRRKDPEIGLLKHLCDAGGVALDVGAHRGLYTYFLTRHARQVVAFEPLKPLAELLSAAFAERARVENVALSDRRGFTEMRVPGGNFAWASIEPANAFAKSAAEEVVEHRVPMARLDDFEFSDVAFIKIDVEGHELAVLEGAERTLRAATPTLLIELVDFQNPGCIGRVQAFLALKGYEGYFVDGSELRPIAEFDPRRDQDPANLSVKGQLGRFIPNFIFIHPTRTPRFHESIKGTAWRLAPARADAARP